MHAIHAHVHETYAYHTCRISSLSRVQLSKNVYIAQQQSRRIVSEKRITYAPNDHSETPENGSVAFNECMSVDG